VKKKISILFLCFIMTIAMIPATVVNATVNTVSVSYQTHVQDIGWQGFVSDGAISGTSGQSKRLEGIEIQVAGDSNLGITYSTHVQDIGWQGFVSDGAMSGTSGQSKRLEAIKIQLTGSDASIYDVYYCVHAENYGWLGWAKNGASAGTAGYSYRLEAIQIVLVPKDSPAPGSIDNSFVQYVPQSAVSYRTHVQDYGWQENVSNGASSGTSGESKRLEGICISLSGMPVSGGITYRTQVQDYGWMSWVSDDVSSGTSGQSKRLEAIQIKLTGDVSNTYDVYYRVHAQDFGWLGWAKNGESAGTEAYSKRLEAIQIVLVAKGGQAPGSTVGAFKKDVTYADKKAAAYAIEFLKEVLKNPNSLIINDISYGFYSSRFVAVIDYNATNSYGGYVRGYLLAWSISGPSTAPYLYNTDVGYVDMDFADYNPSITSPIFVNNNDILSIPTQEFTYWY